MNASVVSRFIEYANSRLLSSPEGQAYLMSRGSTRSQWDRHKIGYIDVPFDPDPSLDHLHDSSCDVTPCDTCRFIQWANQDKLNSAVVYPLSTYSGSLAGFQIRSTREKIYDTFLVSKRPESIFFGLAANVLNIWHSKSVMLAEGPTDMLVLERLAFPTVLALSTNNLNRGQLKFIKRFATNVYLCLDLDDAGRHGIKSIFNKCSDLNVVDVRYPSLGGSVKDPGDLWKALGDERFKIHFHKEIRS